MLCRVTDALTLLRREAAASARVLSALTDASLSHRLAEGQRSIGELAWHIVVSQREIVGKTGLVWAAPGKDIPSPGSAAAIHAAYVKVAAALAAAVEREWTDATLLEEDEIYGERWPRGHTLLVMVLHEVHHRGQLMALMRSAGLGVPGVYGPAGDEKRETGNGKRETGSEKRETGNEKRETRNEKRETRNEKRETRNEKRETRNEKRET